MAQLFDTLKLRDVVLNNRIAIPPMCQYSAPDGMAADWHLDAAGARGRFGSAL